MSIKAKNPRNQHEFFYVFNGGGHGKTSVKPPEKEQITNQLAGLDDDLAKVHREKLIEELREFGC